MPAILQTPTITRPQRLLREGLIASAAWHPEKVALIIKGQSYTYRELFNAAMILARHIHEQGVLRGDRVAIYMDNTWPCVVSIYAVLLAGGVFLIINPQTKEGKLRYVLKDSEAKALITDWHLVNVFNRALQGLPGLETVIVSGQNQTSTDIPGKQIFYFSELLDHNKPLSSPVEVLVNDLAALIYTSGSTGDPKGVMQTHQSMVFAAWSLIEYQRLSKSDRIMLVLPLAFDYGLYQLLMAMKLGATLIIECSFTFPSIIYERMQKEQVTVFPGVPTIFSMMVASHHKNKLAFPSVTRVTNTAAALPEALIPDLKAIFPSALIYKMYGLSECKRVSYLEPELIDDKPGSVGKAIPGTEVFLLKENGEPVRPGEEGILYVRGPHVMLGYWKKPELSAKMLKPGRLPGERVLCTHDLFYMDEEGYLYFISRTDDIIKTRGEKVSPIEIENVLHNIEGVQDAVVIGIADDTLGQAICALIVLEEGKTLTEKLIKKHCMANLENFMMPQDIRFVLTLPKLANGKFDKKRIAEEIQSHE